MKKTKSNKNTTNTKVLMGNNNVRSIHAGFTILIIIFENPTIRESALIDHRAPGAGQLVEMKANGKFILGVGLQISYQEALLTPADERYNRGLKS